MNEKWPWIEGSHGMRSQLLDILSDADLAFSPGGQISYQKKCEVHHTRVSSAIFHENSAHLMSRLISLRLTISTRSK